MENYDTWLKNVTDEGLLAQLKTMNNDEIEDAFYQNLEFGTAGLRGVLGAGTNRMNIYTVAQATFGLGRYVVDAGKSENGVCIAYDSRSNSRLFGEITAKVLLSMGIKVMMFENIKGVPHLSFATTYLNAFCGVIITASHNPASYNGYKVFDHLGCQIGPVVANHVLENIAKVNIFEHLDTLKKPFEKDKIQWIDGICDKGYYDAVASLGKDKNLNKDVFDEPIVYTPLFGAGNIPVQAVLKNAGYENVILVKEQSEPNGSFPNLIQPNPEKEQCFTIAKEYAKKYNAQMIIATDPDCDRLGVAVLNENNEFILLTGNQIGCIIFDYLIKTNKGEMKKPFAVRSIVSTPLVDKIAVKNNIKMFKTLTGFRFIAKVVCDGEKSGNGEFFFGFEESNGFLTGDFVKDKDGCIASLIMVSACNYYKSIGLSLFEALNNIYKEYGYTIDKSISFEFAGSLGKQKMADIMDSLRKEFNPFTAKTIAMEDYKTSVKTFFDGKTQTIDTQQSNVLIWELDDGNRIIARPSGTEPKIKFYITCVGKDLDTATRYMECYEKQIQGLL